MVKFEIKVHPKQRLAYIPKEIFEALGTRLEAIPNLQGVFLYPKGLPPEQVLNSMKAICTHLEQQVAIEKEKEASKNES